MSREKKMKAQELREANQRLIAYVESVLDFFAKLAPAYTRIAAEFRVVGNTELAKLFSAKSKKINLLAKKGYKLLIQTVHLGTNLPE